MEIKRIEDMVGGWFIGNFDPSAYKTKEFEVCYKLHKAGELWDTHYHKIGTEINLLIRGSMSINNIKIKEGDIFIIFPNEISAPVFHTDCEVIIVKTPSIPGDKYIV